jgi:hypothetical protein
MRANSGFWVIAAEAAVAAKKEKRMGFIPKDGLKCCREMGGTFSVDSSKSCLVD